MYIYIYRGLRPRPVAAAFGYVLRRGLRAATVRGLPPRLPGSRPCGVGFPRGGRALSLLGPGCIPFAVCSLYRLRVAVPLLPWSAAQPGPFFELGFLKSAPHFMKL